LGRQTSTVSSDDARSATGTALYRHFGLDPVNFQTNILLADGQAWFESSASIRIFEILGFPWSLMRVFWLVPGSLRDRLYRLIARNRLRWFGVRDVCFVPDPAQMDRFLG